ncbi:MAG: hypothetical protein ACTSX6_00290 [Candidatus Heimdallarchaeaceae archaeon]
MVKEEVISSASNALRLAEEVTAIIEPSGIRVDKYNKILSVPFNIENTILTYTPPSGYKFYLTAVIVSGNLDGEFITYRNSNPILGIRTSSSQRTAYWIGNDKCNFMFSPGETVKVKVTHYEMGKLGEFYSTILGVLTEV